MNKYSNLNIPMDLMMKKRLSFSSFFILENKMQTYFDKYLEEITSKQWLIMMIVSAFPEPPSLTQVAKHAGCSRQNVKKVAAVLEKKGFIEFTTEKNGRAVYIVLTQKFYDFYIPFLEKSTVAIESLFEGLNEEQIEAFLSSLNIIDQNIDKLASTLENEEI